MPDSCKTTPSDFCENQPVRRRQAGRLEKWCDGGNGRSVCVLLRVGGWGKAMQSGLSNADWVL